MIEAVLYHTEMKELWDHHVRHAINGHFMFCRDYMEYHQDRFEDASLLFMEQGQVVSILPGHLQDGIYKSHQGLSFGGFLIGYSCTMDLLEQCFKALNQWLRERSIGEVHYKTIPSVYHKTPAEADRYLLWKLKGQIISMSPYSVIAAGQYQPSANMRKKISKARRRGIQCRETRSLEAFWKLLNDNLQDRYGTNSVHSLAEITLLRDRFPDHIRLFEAFDPQNPEEPLAGALLYDNPQVVHCQYSVISPAGKPMNVFALLYYHIIEVFEHKALSFGISTENGGQFLNPGLIAFKEVLGARHLTSEVWSYKL